VTTINDLIPRYWDYLETERVLQPASCTGYLARCGLDGHGYTFRSLRHSFVSHRLDRGVPIHTVKELAGHKRIDTTAAYAHATSAGKRAAIEQSPLAEVMK